jgi:hypothetical protein
VITGTPPRYIIARKGRFIQSIAVHPNGGQQVVCHVSWTDYKSEAMRLCTRKAGTSMVAALMHHGIDEIRCEEVPG